MEKKKKQKQPMMQKPRPFSHRLIYVDERKEQIASLRGTFAAAQHHQKGRGQRFSIPMLLSLLVIMAAVALLVIFSK